MSTLCLVSDNGEAEPIPLSNRPLTIGRHPDNDLVIRDDRASRFHCVIEPSEQGAWVRDLGSRNGTKVNEEPIDEAALMAGDRIRIGSTVFVLQAGDDGPRPQAAVKPPQQAEPEPALPEMEEEAPAEEPQPTQPRGPEPEWVADLRTTIEALPPQGKVTERVTLIDAEGRPTEVLREGGSGPVAIRLLLLTASKSRATDIHIEPKGEKVIVRMRVDGQMLRMTDFPNEVGQRAMGLIKNACHMKSAGRDAVLDGHFSARVSQRRVDFRASFTPSVHGQKLVIRVLDMRDAPRSLTDLNMNPYMLKRIRKSCQQDSGMVLVCGPTGSGKTTTLYNALREIDRETRNVITIEDPVEYRLEGVTQIPADVSRGRGFAELLRSVLRQDPDVILLGEIRDEDSARVAMQAAMTGHLVFTTVHAKDTIGAVFRLLDLGVEPYLIASSLDLLLAQRLVRVLCEDCKRPIQPSPAQATRMGRYLEGSTTIHAAAGCPKCLHTGFRGRHALFELLDVNDELRDVILHEPTIQSMKKVIEQDVFTTLEQAGWQKVAKGYTSLDEVDRVAP